MSAPPRGPRFLFIDALRGIAALAVVLCHLGAVPPLRDPLAEILPHFLFTIIEHGHLGVPVFFVLSGFVIAHSLRDARVSLRFFGRFALRRSLRLDPPYWLAILLAVAVLAAAQLATGSTERPLPSFTDVLAHMLYVQNIVGVPNIVSQFWTLPLELQFYLVYCAHLALEQLLVRRAVSSRWARVWTFAPLALASLVLLRFDVASHGLFVASWYSFLAGALVQWTICGRASAGWWVLFAGAVLAVDQPASEHMLGAITTSGLLLVVSRLGGLATWLSARWLQWLGRISYSLYLTHFIAGALSKSSGRLIDGSGPRALVGLAVGVSISLLVAWVFYVAVEAPSLRWAQQPDPVGFFRGRVHALARRRRPAPPGAPPDGQDREAA